MSNALKVFATLCHVVTRSIKKNLWNDSDEDIVVLVTNRGTAMVLITPNDVERTALDKDRYSRKRVMVPSDAVVDFVKAGGKESCKTRDYSIVMEKGVVRVSVWATPTVEIVRTCKFDDLAVARNDRRIADRTMQTDAMLCEDDEAGSFENDLLLLIKRHSERRAVQTPKAEEKPAPAPKTASPKETAPAAKPVPQPPRQPQAQRPAAAKPSVARIGGATLAAKLGGLTIAPDGQVVKKDVVAATPAPTPVEPAPVAATSPAAKAPGDEPAPTPVEPEAPAPVETKTDDGAPSLDDLVAQTLAATPAPAPVEPAPVAATPEPEAPATTSPVAATPEPVAAGPSATPATAKKNGGGKKPKAKKGGKALSDAELELQAAANAGRNS